MSIALPVERFIRTAMHRVFGFDLLRALAILLVFFGHADLWVDDLSRTPLHVLSDRLDVINGPFGLWGVELFFALSGVLIGRILLRLFTQPDGPGWAGVMRFWMRRWLRTLPSYWVVLLLLLVVPGIIAPERPGPSFVLLVQNLTSAHPPAFGEAWSLSVEEWSYVLIPLVLLACMTAFRSRKRGLVIAIMLIAVVGFTLRVGNAWTCDCRPDQDIRKVVLFRTDALAAGMLMAYMLERWPERMERWRFTLLAAGVLMWMLEAVAGYMRNGILHGMDHFGRSGSPMAMALDITWLDVAFTLMMPWAAHTVAMRPRALIAPVVWISGISYPLYLVHRSLVAIPLMRIDRSRWDPPEGWMAFACCVAAFGLAYVIHVLVERPLMRWRDRRFPEGRRL